MPRPDSVTTAITMPAQAQAVATPSAFLAPSTNASIRFSQPRQPRVDRRSAATGKQASVPSSAAMGAL